jgi:hypothetical protein
MQILLHPSDRPIFRLGGSVVQCRVEVRINDVPVLRDASDLAHEFDLSINEWLFQGINRIDVRLNGVEKDAPIPARASFNARLAHKAARDAVRNIGEIGKFSWKSDPVPAHEHAGHSHHPDVYPPDESAQSEPDAPLLALPGQPEDLHWTVRTPQSQADKSILISTLLPLPPPWPICPWIRGSALASQGGTQRVIIGMMRSVHQTLRNGGWEEFFKSRRAALQAAYYLGGDEVDEALGFPTLLDQRFWQLQPVAESNLQLELAGQGKLARLLDPATGESPLVLVNESACLSATIDAWWMFANEWVLVR